MEVTLLDFDGTITCRDTTRALVLALLRSRPWRAPRVAVPLSRLAIGGPEQEIQKAKDQCVGTLLQGLSGGELDVGLHRYHAAVSPLLRPKLVSMIKERVAAGQHVLVVTASAEQAVRYALRDLPVTVLGTRFSQRDGRFTGEIDGAGCYGSGKVPMIRAWAHAQPSQPRFVEAWSDSLSDLPMLELAEKRVWICRKEQVHRIRERDPQGQIVQVA